MDRVAQLKPAGRRDLFDETGARMNLPAVIIEKDFWVCWILKQLFAIPETRERVLFKGGTSLAKVFNLIRRFSEDIDLAVDYAALGFTGERDPLREMSHTQREKLLAEMMAACQRYIAGPLVETLRARNIAVLGTDANWSIDISPQDPNIILFRYPTALASSLSYIQNHVALELGTHAEWVPRDQYTIRPYAAEQFPEFFADSACDVTAIRAERTFWEKATILHMEFHRAAEKPMPARYARHYSDLATMAAAAIKTVALENLSLLERVCRHKERFYRCPWARYDLARPGSLRLVPPASRVASLRNDYAGMRVMFFDVPPTIERVLQSLQSLEEEINRLP